MGRWYVVAAIPTFLERDAHDAVESYELNTDGTIATTFTFRRGSFDGPVKTYEPRGYIESESNAIWGMQFVWPFKADYRVIYLDAAYSETIIGRQKRDYVWVMARRPVLPDRDLDALIDRVAAAGYDRADIVRVPQQPLAQRTDAGLTDPAQSAIYRPR
jgi:apolipoprotein D and lipocalin family protein